MRTRTSRYPFVLAAVLLGACTRSVPATFPSASAASSDAAEAPVAPIGLALRADPPLPGESTDGWEGLERSAPDATPPAHRGHHHAH